MALKNWIEQNPKLRTATEYVAAVVLCVILLLLVMHLRRAYLRVPFEYVGDSLFHSMVIKGMIDNGWYVRNPYLGAPGQMQLYDFPVTENAHMATMKLLTLFTSDHASILNLFFLLTFPLTTITSLYVFRHFGISYAPALLGSLLYTFLPYHFLRNEHHLFLAAYYLIPLTVLVMLWIFGGLTFFVRPPGGRGPRLQFNKRILASLLVCIAIGSSGVYYPFFTCFLLLVAGLMGSSFRKSVLPILSAMILAGVVALVVFVNLLPAVIYTRRHGESKTMTREVGEAEVYGLKISQLVLPITFHRLEFLRGLKDRYNRNAPLITENDTASLGFIGTIGFLFLVGWMFLRLGSSGNAEWRRILDQLSTLNIAALLLATIGGFASVFALAVSPRIRTYNRISIFIAFFSLFAICLRLDMVFRRRVNSKKTRALFYASIAVLLGLGILDQTGQAEYYRPDFERQRVRYHSDAAFVQQIEAQLRPGATIFQLPYATFPEQGPIEGMGDYSHFRGYLHSRGLRWSFGAMKQRPDDDWQRHVATQPTEQFLQQVTFAGFEGIFINRDGYQDRAGQLEADLSALLNTQPLVSRQNDLSFFNLSQYRARLEQQHPGEAWATQRELALRPLLFEWTNGCYDLEKAPGIDWNWCSARGELRITNGSNQTRKVLLKMEFATAYSEPSRLQIQAPTFSDSLSVNSTVQTYTREVMIPPGVFALTFVSDANRVNAPWDVRPLVFRVSNFRLLPAP